MEMPAPNPAVLALKPRLVARLQEVLAPDAVIHDEAETRAYECDALTAYRCPPLCAVLPSTTQQVSDVLRICHESDGHDLTIDCNKLVRLKRAAMLRDQVIKWTD